MPASTFAGYNWPGFVQVVAGPGVVLSPAEARARDAKWSVSYGIFIMPRSKTYSLHIRLNHLDAEILGTLKSMAQARCSFVLKDAPVHPPVEKVDTGDTAFVITFDNEDEYYVYSNDQRERLTRAINRHIGIHELSPFVLRFQTG